MNEQIAAKVAEWRTKADDYMRISKAYNCRSNEALKTAYIKQAAQLRMCADELEALNAKAGNAEAEGTGAGIETESSTLTRRGSLRPRARRTTLAQDGGAGEGEGSVPMPDVRTGDD